MYVLCIVSDSNRIRDIQRSLRIEIYFILLLLQYRQLLIIILENSARHNQDFCIPVGTNRKKLKLSIAFTRTVE